MIQRGREYFMQAQVMTAVVITIGTCHTIWKGNPGLNLQTIDSLHQWFLEDLFYFLA
jgi:hypothetical protein